MPGIINTIKRQIDLPFWEQLRLSPTVSSALSCTCAPDNSNFHPQQGRYVYYLISATQFWRYDTWMDSYIQLSSPPIPFSSWSSMRFASSSGFEGLVLSAGTNTITAPVYYGKSLKSYDLYIVNGTGQGQRRIITDVADSVVADTGVPTAVNNALGAISLTDTTKTWTINQWAGFQARITFGPGVGQVRRILNNSSTQLFFADLTKSADTVACSPMLFSPAISATAGSQSTYQIESSTITVDSPWQVQPDTTSQFRIATGSIFLYSSNASSPFYTIQQYDVLSDTWIIRTSNSNNVAFAATDSSIERCTEAASTWERGTATSGTTTTLIDANKNWNTNQWTGYYVRVFSGTGEGLLRPILSNTSSTLTWTTVGTSPDTTSNYLIEGFDSGTATSGTTATLVDSTKTWTVNRWSNFAVRITAGTGRGQTAQVLSNTATTLTTVKAFATAPDATSTYTILGDTDKQFLILGNNAALLIHNVDDDLATYGRLADSGAARQLAVQFGAQKAQGLTSITFSTTTATATTAQSHHLKVGQQVVVSGATGADAVRYNGTFTIATVPSITTFTYTMGGTPTGNATFTSHTTTTLTDSTKTWTTNQWAGFVCYMTTTPVTTTGVATGQAFQILSNTATTLTFVGAGTAPTNGVSRYVLSRQASLGNLDFGLATGAQSTTTLQDTTKTWVVNIWSGRRVKFLAGTGQSQELLITSNTANTLTFGGATAPVTGVTTYSILQTPLRGVGIELNWTYGLTDLNIRGRYLVCPRGGGVVGFDRLDLTTDKWDLMSITPQIETLSTGSMYAYDSGDRIYFTKEVTQRLYYLDIVTNTVHGAGIYPYAPGTAIIGNRMEIFSTADGIKFIWLNRHSQLECFRALLIQ